MRTNTRNQQHRLQVRIFVILSTLLSTSNFQLSTVHAQGSLTPPGAPAPTMKTLAEIEPATAITNLPFSISLPGAYFVERPLSSSSSGITITTNDVDLDLRGFTLTGSSGASTDHGIILAGSSASPRLDIVVRNGSLSGFHHGVQSADAAQCVFENLSIHSCAKVGIQFNSSPAGLLEGNTIRDCVISQTGDMGISFTSAAGAQCRQNVVEDCLLTDTGGTSIGFADVGGEVRANRIVRCLLSFSSDQGISLLSTASGETSGNSIEECSVHDTTADGILLSADSGSCSGNDIRRCTISHAGSLAGIQLTAANGGTCNGNLIEDNSVSEQALFGILLLNTSTVAGNILRGNLVDSGTNYGVRVESAIGTRIENNHVHSATGAVSSVGIYTSPGSSDNLIIRNSSIGHAANYSISASDTYGPFITGSGALASTGQESHPAANFSQ